ncbi:hypothetical protein BB560_007242, partial [Smittium megazygosporum]
MVFFPQIPNLRINIFQEKKKVTIRGTKDESAGFVIGGYIIIEPNTKVKVKSLKVQIINKLNHNWIQEDLNPCKKYHKINISENHLISDYKVLDPQKYNFSFSLPLEGNITESIYLGRLKNKYYIKALVEYYGAFGS